VGWLGNALKGAAKFIPVVGDIAGALIGGNASAKAQKKANQTNIQLQRENQAWEEKMSNTSYQRAMNDMMNAGLNPMLAYQQGGANTPSTSAATVDSTGQQWTDVGKHVGSAAGIALQRKLLEKQMEQLDANIAKTLSEGEAVRATIPGINAESAAKSANLRDQMERQAQLLQEQINSVLKDQEIKDLDIAQKRQLMPLLVQAQELINAGKSSENISTAAEAAYYDKMGPAGVALDKAGAIGGAIGSLKSLIEYLRGKVGTDRVIDKSTGEILSTGRRRK
jgi:hypothetical protein